MSDAPLKEIDKNATLALYTVHNIHMSTIDANKLEEYLQKIIETTVTLIEEGHG